MTDFLQAARGRVPGGLRATPRTGTEARVCARAEALQRARGHQVPVAMLRGAYSCPAA